MAARWHDGVVGGASTDLRLRPRNKGKSVVALGMVATSTVEREQGLPNVECLCVMFLCVRCVVLFLVFFVLSVFVYFFTNFVFLKIFSRINNN